MIMRITRPRPRQSTDGPYEGALRQLAEIIRQETHTDASLFEMIAHMIPTQPVFAMALCDNIGRVLTATTDAVDYVEVLIEAYRRTLFIPGGVDGGPHLDLFEGNPEAAARFAKNVKLIHGAANICFAGNDTAH